MQSKFSIAGHPLHPTLVALPIGLFTGAVASMLVYLFAGRDDDLWYDMAMWAGFAGVVTGLIAALPGFGDYLTLAVNSSARAMATAHMALNLAAVALFAIASLLMIDDGARAGWELTLVVVLQILGIGLLGLAGFLGGELVFRHRLAVMPEGGTSRQEAGTLAQRSARTVRNRR